MAYSRMLLLVFTDGVTATPLPLPLTSKPLLLLLTSERGKVAGWVSMRSCSGAGDGARRCLALGRRRRAHRTRRTKDSASSATKASAQPQNRTNRTSATSKRDNEREVWLAVTSTHCDFARHHLEGRERRIIRSEGSEGGRLALSKASER